MDIDRVLAELTLEEKASLCSGADFWHTKAVERLGVPAVMMCDGPNGLRKQSGQGDHMGLNESLRTVCFPTASAVAASWDKELAHSLGETLGEECRAEQISLLLGPGMNIKRSPLCGRNFEYYSEDPLLSSKIGRAYIEGLQSKGIGACVKHFAANNQETGRMVLNAVLDERTLHEIYLESFREAITEGEPWAVMCSYNQVNGTFLSENKELLTNVLRDAWGYAGFVVTDWGAVKDRVTGIDAGLDLEMPGGVGSLENDQKIVEAVRSGKLTEEQLDKVVRRILEFLDRATAEKPAAAINLDADYKKAEQMAEQCAVLLKNNGVLPLDKEQKMAFIGGFVEKPRYQGSGSSHIHSANVPTIKELIQGRENISYAKGFEIGEESTDPALMEEAVNLARRSDVAIIFAGLPNRYEMESADRKHIDLPANQNELIASVAAVQPNTIVILHNGAPVAMPWVNEVSAILEMYLGGDGVSEATLKLLFGEANPCGKLAETFPMRLEDTSAYLNYPGENHRVEYSEGVFVGYRYYDKRDMPVLFPFGHGLSYTSFEYSDFTLDKASASADETVTAAITVTNTGKRTGSEIVQLYVGSKSTQIRRPVRELRGFEKITLLPGESKTVQFVLTGRDFAYYETRFHDFYAESGQYEISVGSSSRDIRAAAIVSLTAVRSLPVHITQNTTLGELMRIPGGAEMMAAMRAGGESGIDHDNSALGEEGDAIAHAMMEEMPIGALSGYGLMTSQQLAGLITMLDAKLGHD